ncbi:LPS export ABC transporter permease LptF [Methylovirgula sp. 4M-Z18]|uniref:LPS export ABC transporter permease LptF n=1 Tax=Methylovirgula sp. 4M-Z18 TaxID=2293567 RepID=UPI000E2E94B1|nr:LPS export ABC transporter permease LptF [Methylovirgula sp. 4M-Z18]RFB81007.1 LPS export ABC transporter permease LptF [Methylovirgula sp. 4M-Z18]
MSLVERYLFKSLLTAFLACLFALTAVIWIAVSLRFFNLLTTQGQSIVMFFSITGLTIPQLVLYIAPFALFVAVIVTLDRSNTDSELIVMSAAGQSPSRLIRPFLAVMLLVSALVASLSLDILPWSLRETRTLLAIVRSDFLTRVVRPGVFTALEDGFVFHFRERAPDGALLGVFMQDRRDATQVNTYLAERGEAVTGDGVNLLDLERGSIQRQKQGDPDAAIVQFKSYAIDLAQFGPKDDKDSDPSAVKPAEMTTYGLFHLNMASPNVRKLKGRYRAELYERFVNPLYAFVFGLVGFAALGHAKTTRQGRGVAIASAIGLVAVIRVSGLAASTLLVKLAGMSILVVGIPVTAVIVALAYSFMPALRSYFHRPRPLRLQEELA